MSKEIIRAVKVQETETEVILNGNTVEIGASFSCVAESMMEGLKNKGFGKKDAAEFILYAAKLGIESWLEKNQESRTEKEGDTYGKL